MSMKSIEVRNFKSFKDLKINPGKFNVLIGANASGKSNFVQIFGFLSDIANYGLDNAVSLQGGTEYLQNMNIGASENTYIKVVSDQKFGWVRETKAGLIGIKTYELIYEFALKFNTDDSGFEISKDKLTQKCNFVRLERKEDKIEEKETLGGGEILISCSNRSVKIDPNIPENVPLKKEDLYPQFLREEKLPEHALILETPYFFIPSLESIFEDIAIYDFDPKLPKKAASITGKAELEEDGSNLSIILKNIAENKEKRRKLFNLVNDILPFVKDLNVEKFADKSLLFKLKESYFKTQYLPASLISDGTINITALIIALYFEKKAFVIFEEPNRNIHPYLISKMVEMMKDASQKKQIVVTTHSPEFIRHAELESILLVSRDENGFSTIYRPADKEDVRAFLKNKIGIEELYIQNLLEV